LDKNIKGETTKVSPVSPHEAHLRHDSDKQRDG